MPQAIRQAIQIANDGSSASVLRKFNVLTSPRHVISAGKSAATKHFVFGELVTLVLPKSGLSSIGAHDKSQLRGTQARYLHSADFGETGVSDTYVASKHPSVLLVVATARTIISEQFHPCLLYTSPSPRDATLSRMPSSA